MNEIKIQLPELYAKQKEIKEHPAKTKVICAGRQVGKSTLLRDVAITSMLQGKEVCYITPSFFLADEMLGKLFDIIPPALIKSSNRSNRQIVLITGGRIMFFSGEALERARGFGAMDLLLVDEAAHIPALQKEYYGAIRALLLKKNGDVYFVSTPYGRNWFYKIFNDGNEGINGFKSWQFTTYENPHLPPEALQLMVAEMPKAQYNEEILAEPSESSDSAFGGAELIRKATLKELSKEPAVVYGIDVAFQGNDRFVITGLDGNGHMCHFEAYQNLPFELLQSKVEALPSNVTKAIDATGNGWVFYESCSRTCSNLIPFIWTSSNKPTVIMEMIRDVENGKLMMNEETANEAYVYQYKKLPNGTTTYQAQGSYRDDAIAALALANHHKVQAEANANWKLYTA